MRPRFARDRPRQTPADEAAAGGLDKEPWGTDVLWRQPGPAKGDLPVKHATSAALEKLSELLEQIRTKDGIQEKKLGIFYRRSKSFLHFHEDPAGLFADLTVGDGFDRYPVNTRPQWTALLTALDEALGR